MNDPHIEPSLPAIAKTFGAFRYRPFLLFWIGACISNTGNWTENAAQSWAVTSQMVGNPHQGMYVELLQFADFCPVLVLALLAGVISDRVNRKTWLIILQAVAGVLGAGLAVAAFLGRATPVVVIVFTFLEGIVWALNGPVFLAVVPSLVPKGFFGSRPRAELHPVQHGPALRADARGTDHRGGGSRGRFHVERLHLSSAAGRVVVLHSDDSQTATHRDDLHARGHSRRLEVCVEKSRHPAADDHGLGLHVPERAVAGSAARVCAERAQRRSGALWVDALSDWLGSILGAFVLSYIPSYYPRHHLIPLAMSVFAAIGMLFSYSTAPALSLVILVACGTCWLLSLNSSNTANQLLATDANRGRVLSVMLLAQQGGMPLGHLFAGFLTHYMSPQWVLRLMLGTLLVVMPIFLLRREPAIDNMDTSALG